MGRVRKNKESALTILDEGLSKFGQTNSELVMAKAKVLYRSDDHEGSLELYRKLIASEASLGNVEKAFLGREAGICAEMQGDFKAARHYYLFGSVAAKKADLPNMAAMHVGLLADAAIASWRDGERQTCLQDFVVALEELNNFNSDASLQAAHCHAATRHVLLWLNQEATGEKQKLQNGEDVEIYPGCVSNPERHSEIGELSIPPIEFAWYMLAAVENNAALNAGITKKFRATLTTRACCRRSVSIRACKNEQSFVFVRC